MDIVAGAIGSIGPKLLELLKDEYKLHKDLRKEIQSLSDELESVHAALRKVADVPWDKLDEQVKIWARQVREASYDMEDVLDRFLVRVEVNGPAKKGRLKRAMKKMGGLFSKGRARHDIVGTIEGIKKQLQEVAERRARYKVDDIEAKPAAPSTIDPRLEATYKEKTQLISIDKARGELMSKMLPHDGNDSNGKTKMVSVVGIGGLGKTTLAKEVYDKIKHHFDCDAFVPVGRNPDLKKVFRDILINLNGKYMDTKYNILDERQLIDELRYFLQSKRYFIVMDDVWETESWDKINLAFFENGRGSTIIKTTRKSEVATGDVYKLQQLSYDQSKILFYRRLFLYDEGEFSAKYPAEASEKILKKCGGVPLAIITMASMLLGKPRQFWFDVCKSPGFYCDSNDQKARNTMWILSLSYYDLPSYLKTCLLYLSMYPEDYLIVKESLIWKWVAEGFVEKKTGTSLFQRGEEYFNQLINRSMIQAVESEKEGVYGCRVHDMVLDLIRELSDEVNFVSIFNNDEGTSPFNNKMRRLAYQNRMMTETRQDDHIGMYQVRSLVARSCDIISWVLPPSFELLRVLDLKGCKSGNGWRGLKHLGKLLHLRYLGLQGINIKELPKKIGALKHLQTLDLKGNIINKLPSSITMLTQLVCLRCFSGTMPDGFIKKLTSLEELYINYYLGKDKSKKQFVNEIGNLREVRVLQVFHLWTLTNNEFDESMESDLLRSLGKLQKLQRLHIANIRPYEASTVEWGTAKLPLHLRHLAIENIWFPLLPSSINSEHLPNLTHLCLDVGHMDQSGLRALGGLPELCYLNLTTHFRRPVMASTVTVVHGYFFQKLRYCRLCGFMVQLVPNEDSNNFSFTIWNGENAMAFGSRTKDECSTVLLPVIHHQGFIQGWKR